MAQLLAVIATSAFLSFGCLLLHYETLRLISCFLPALRLPPRNKILVVIGAALLGHLIEIACFAAGFLYLIEDNVSWLAPDDIIVQSIYISFESYTSLGTSSGFPIGPLRLLAGIEALTGLILISWTASYTYLAMRDLWDKHG